MDCGRGGHWASSGFPLNSSVVAKGKAAQGQDLPQVKAVPHSKDAYAFKRQAPLLPTTHQGLPLRGGPQVGDTAHRLL